MITNAIVAGVKADLDNITFNDNLLVVLLGNTVIGDTDARMYGFDSTSSATSDGNLVIRPSMYASTNGRLIRKNWNQSYNDARYKAIGYSPTSSEIISALGFTPGPAVSAPSITTPTIVLGASYQAPNNKNIWVNASITHTIALTLVLTSGSSLVQLQVSPNNSTWTTINRAGYSDGVSVAVSLTKSITNNVCGEVPPNYYYRLIATTSGAGSAAITDQQLKSY